MTRNTVSRGSSTATTGSLSSLVREASMRAGKMIISNYSTKAIDLLLPELEKGMLDGAWRIRVSRLFAPRTMLNLCSNRPFRSRVNSYIESRVSAAKWSSRKKRSLPILRTMQGKHCSKLLAPSDEIESLRLSILFDRTMWGSSDRRPFIYGRLWCRVSLTLFDLSAC